LKVRPKEVVISVTAKTVTTVVAIVMGEQYDAIIPLLPAVIISGPGSMAGPVLCQKSGITDPRL